MTSNSRRQAATIAVARGSRLGRRASAGATPANPPPPMTMLRCAGIPVLVNSRHGLYLLHDYSWAKQGLETKLTPVVIPGWSEGPDPESRDSGFDASHRPGMTTGFI